MATGRKGRPGEYEDINDHKNKVKVERSGLHGGRKPWASLWAEQEGQGLSWAPPPCGHTPSLKGVGLEARARATAKPLHHGLRMQLRGGSYCPPRDGNVGLDVPGWGEDQVSSHGKLLTTIIFVYFFFV